MRACGVAWPLPFTVPVGMRLGVLRGGSRPAFAAVCMGEHQQPVVSSRGTDPHGRTIPPEVVHGCPCAPCPADAVPEAFATHRL